MTRQEAINYAFDERGIETIYAVDETPTEFRIKGEIGGDLIEVRVSKED